MAQVHVTKDWLGFENARNKRNAHIYTELMKRAIAGDCAVLIGHHLTFEVGGDLATENEIPSADCLMFDHDIMGAVFGEDAIGLMRRLASVPCDQRDVILAKALGQPVSMAPELTVGELG